jgi:fructokinase
LLLLLRFCYCGCVVVEQGQDFFSANTPIMMSSSVPPKSHPGNNGNKTAVTTMVLSSFMFLLLSNIHVANAFTTSSCSLKDYGFQHRHTSKKATVALQSSSRSSTTDNDSSIPLPNVLCIGETLWDSLPSGIYLGGAPSNVAVHLAYLFNVPSSSSNEVEKNKNRPTVAIAACLGKDQLGKEAQRRLALNGVRTDYVQYHSEWETGMATALLDSNGDATYEFNTPAAWDGLCLDPNLKHLIQQQQQQTDGQEKDHHHVLFVMGTIAGRLHNDYGATSLSTLMSVRNTAPEGTVILDINLRSPWYKDETVLELARGSSEKKLALLKVNEEELAILEQWCGMDTNIDDLFGDALKTRMEHLAQSLNTQRLCVTRGHLGAALWCDDGNKASFDENPGYSLPNKNNDSDTVGAGDAFLASLINSLFIHGETSAKALERACALGGYVAGCRGATPSHGDAPDALRNLFSI